MAGSRSQIVEGLTPLHAWLLLAGLLVGGIVLRVETIGGHLSNDEGYSYLIGSAPSVGAFLHRLAAYENTPSLFYLLLTPLPLTNGVGWLRLPAAVPGALIPLMLFALLRKRLGLRAALLAAALVAVAPFEVSYSDYSRGFMLEGVGCMLGLWAMLRILDGGGWRWWLLYVIAGIEAVYSEYLAIIFLVALTISAFVTAPRYRWRIGLLGLAPILSLAPWIGQIERGQRALHQTKQFATFPGPSLSSLRDVTVRVAAGEHGAAAGTGARWLEFLVIVAVLAGAAAVLYRRVIADPRHPGRRTVLVIAMTGVLVLIGHALVSELGTGSEIFYERYLTVLIPLAAAIIAAAMVELPSRWAWRVGMLGAALVGVAVFAQRYHREYEPSLAPVRVAVAALHPRTVLTNSAVVVYYLREFSPILDRPFGLGPGLQRSCLARCVIVDDSRVPGGTRPAPGPSGTVGFFNVRIETKAQR